MKGSKVPLSAYVLITENAEMSAYHAENAVYKFIVTFAPITTAFLANFEKKLK